MTTPTNAPEPGIVDHYVQVDDGGPMAATLTTPAREPHDELFSAIERLDTVIDHLTWLRNRILGQESNPPEGPERPTPSLKYVLSNGSREIDDRGQQLINLVDDINMLLFSDGEPEKREGPG